MQPRSAAASALADIADLANKLSSADIEILEKNLAAMDEAVSRIRGGGKSSSTGRMAASPAVDDPDKQVAGPEVSSDPSVP